MWTHENRGLYERKRSHCRGRWLDQLTCIRHGQCKLTQDRSKAEHLENPLWPWCIRHADWNRPDVWIA